MSERGEVVRNGWIHPIPATPPPQGLCPESWGHCPSSLSSLGPLLEFLRPSRSAPFPLPSVSPALHLPSSPSSPSSHPPLISSPLLFLLPLTPSPPFPPFSPPPPLPSLLPNLLHPSILSSSPPLHPLPCLPPPSSPPPFPAPLPSLLSPLPLHSLPPPPPLLLPPLFTPPLSSPPPPPLRTALPNPLPCTLSTAPSAPSSRLIRRGRGAGPISGSISRGRRRRGR